MTEELKDILISKMIDAPESLTSDDLEMILGDEELKDIYNVSSAVGGAMISRREMDVEQEWRLFRHRILTKPSLSRRFMRVAAIFLGVVVASGIIGKVLDYTLTKGYEKQVAASVVPESPTVNESDTPRNMLPAVESPIETREAMVNQKEIVKTATPKIRVKETVVEEEIDVDEYLRIQQEDIENEIIKQNAEIYVDELYAMREFLSDVSDNNEANNE